MSLFAVLLHFTFWLLGFILLWRIPYPRYRSLPDPPPVEVSIIIPARNEERNLARLLCSLENQSFKPIEIIVVDDASGDATAEVGRKAGCRVIPSSPLPEDWAGKPWGCWQGANLAKGNLFIFLDADTFLDHEGLAKIVSTYMEEKGLLTIQPYHRMERVSERLSAVFNIVTMAGMNTFTPWGEKAKPMGAFGPCNVCSREDYFLMGGHQKVRGEVLESLGLGKQFLRANRKVRLFGGKGAISFRMYPEGIGSMIEGFGKGLWTGAQAMSPPILLMAICWITGGVGVTRHFLYSLILADSPGFLVSIAMYLLYALQYHWMLRRVGNFGFLPALLFPIPLLFFIGVFGLSFLQIFLLGRVRWKGRVVKTLQKDR
jgi:4,4'-diaponeurosporenoate glycosyltransferase